MSVKESKIKHLVREYLLDEEILRKNIDEPKLEFGFQFTFPPGPKGQNMVVFKPKSKNLLIFSLGTQISPPHVEALNTSTEKKMHFFIALRKFLLLRNLLFRIDGKNFRYEISEQFFLDKDATLSKDKFFKKIRNVFNSAAYANMLLDETCAGKIKPGDFDKSKDFSSASDFSLYS